MSAWKVARAVVFNLGWLFAGIAGAAYGIKWAANLFTFFAFFAVPAWGVCLLAVTAVFHDDDIDLPNSMTGQRPAEAVGRFTDVTGMAVAAAAGWFWTAAAVAVQFALCEMTWGMIHRLFEEEDTDG